MTMLRYKATAHRRHRCRCASRLALEQIFTAITDSVQPDCRHMRLRLLDQAQQPCAPRADDLQVMARSAACLSLAASGELAKRVEAAYRHLEDCDLCARYCRVNRRKGIAGAVCRTGERALVASYGPLWCATIRISALLLVSCVDLLK